MHAYVYLERQRKVGDSPIKSSEDGAEIGASGHYPGSPGQHPEAGRSMKWILHYSPQRKGSSARGHVFRFQNSEILNFRDGGT